MPFSNEETIILRAFFNRPWDRGRFNPHNPTRALLFGMQGVGLDSLLTELCHGGPEELRTTFDPTGPPDWYKQTVVLQEGNVGSVVEWESAHSRRDWDPEQLKLVLADILPSTDVLALAFHVGDRETFDFLAQAHNIACRVSRAPTPPRERYGHAKLVTIVVATNTDIPPEKWTITREEARDFTNRIGAAAFLETSAKTGDGVQEMCAELAGHTLLVRAEAFRIEEQERIEREIRGACTAHGETTSLFDVRKRVHKRSFQKLLNRLR